MEFIQGGSYCITDLLFPHFKQAASPSKCCAWPVPVLIEHHWYLLEIDWIDGVICIYDSIATSKIHQCLFEFVLHYWPLLQRILKWIAMTGLWSQSRSVVFIVAWPDSDLLHSVAITKWMATIAKCMCYAIYIACHKQWISFFACTWSGTLWSLSLAPSFWACS